MQGKILLSLVSALIAWLIKALWDHIQTRQRWRRLAPLILRQLRLTAATCSGRYDTDNLRRDVEKLAASQALAIELVAAGVRTDDWLQGLEHIADVLDAAHAAVHGEVSQQSSALTELRSRSGQLEHWATALQQRHPARRLS